MVDKYYITDVLNRTGVQVKYKNNASNKEYTLEPNDVDHPTADYIRSSDYLTGGDLIPYSSSTNISQAIKILVLKDGFADMIIYRPDDSIQLGKAEDGGTWVDVSGQNVSSGLSDGKKLILQVAIVGDECQLQFWPDTDLQVTNGYIRTNAWPLTAVVIMKLKVSAMRPAPGGAK